MNAYLKHIERPPVTIETSATTSTALFITISAICFNIHQRTMASTGLAPFIFAWYFGLTKNYKLLPNRYPSWFSLSLQLAPYSPYYSTLSPTTLKLVIQLPVTVFF
ncbi:MAG: hypothetical protein QGF47_13475 [Arenicellales bacterium]|jgi:hypothetical protein|nr:hypothetical protein [Arenicellales bacterium]HJL57436.1 hypothetical protein [Arenicellales bacterium]|tara:strand:+ start:766 stop:1083 length:318 start_codon:yes stop_codon:yes gene_type:complete